MKDTNTLHFLVNGVEKTAPIGNEGSFGDLLEYVRNTMSSDTCCISSIKVDGAEISEAEEVAIAPMPLSELKSVEVFTAHPRELAEETLQNLIVFTEHLMTLSSSAGQRFLAQEHPSRELAKLIDGIDTFVEALNGAKQILRAGALSRIQVLEADLSSIMKDVFEFYDKGELAYVGELLCEHLPKNLEDWRVDGLPSLIRSRDS